MRSTPDNKGETTMSMADTIVEALIEIEKYEKESSDRTWNITEYIKLKADMRRMAIWFDAGCAFAVRGIELNDDDKLYQAEVRKDMELEAIEMDKRLIENSKKHSKKHSKKQTN